MADQTTSEEYADPVYSLYDDDREELLADYPDEGQKTSTKEDAKGKALLIAFLMMVVIGSANKILNPLVLIPFRNYPLFTNLLTNFIYIPAMFAYVFPMVWWGSLITPEQLAIPKHKFAIMGLLDCIAGLMQSISTAYIANGGLITLLGQSAIPASMIISRLLLGTKYGASKIVGALIVLVGLVLAIIPVLTDKDDNESENPLLWSAVFVLASIPQCLSSVYKEIALGQQDVDALYLNGWVAFFQFFGSVLVLIPSNFAVDVAIKDIPDNLLGGWACLWGTNSILTGDHPDDCSNGPLFFWSYMVVNLGYNIVIILILKAGSANILWLAMTIMVPVANAAFALPFVPNHKPFTIWAGMGLFFICGGLFVYRFWTKFAKRFGPRGSKTINSRGITDSPMFGPPKASASSNEPGGLNTPARGVDGFHTQQHNIAARQQNFDEDEDLAYEPPKYSSAVGHKGPSSRARGGQ